MGFCPCPTKVLIVSKIHRSGDSQTTVLTSTGSQAGLYLSKTSLPWSKKWQPTPVFLPGESHGQRILAGYSPRGRKELNMTERLNHGPPMQLVIKRRKYTSELGKGGYKRKKQIIEGRAKTEQEPNIIQLEK